MEKCILLTGFEPFGVFKENPSQDVARALSGRVINGYHVVGITMPYDSRRVKENLLDKIDAIKPEIVLMLGQSFAQGPEITLEGKAHNFVDYDADNLVDNTGYKPSKGVIVEDGPQDLRTLLLYKFEVPFSFLTLLMHKTKIPFDLSFNAGKNFCNETYYRVLLKAHEEDSYKALFIHLPPYDTARRPWPLYSRIPPPLSWKGEEGLDLEYMVAGVHGTIDLLTQPESWLEKTMLRYHTWRRSRDERKVQAALGRMEQRDSFALQREVFDVVIANGGINTLGDHAYVRTPFQCGVDFTTNRPTYHTRFVPTAEAFSGK